MKKLLILTFAVLAATAVFAQHTTIHEDMRIFVKDGEEVLTRFPSKYLDNDARINVILPKNYDTAQNFPTVYSLGHESMDKPAAQKIFGASDFWDRAIFIVINIKGGGNIGDFIFKELLPFADTNYKTDALAQSRFIMAEGKMAADVLQMLADNKGYVYNAALLLQDNMAMPAPQNPFSGNLKIFAAGRVGNIARLQQMLEEKGLKFPVNFAAVIFEPQDDARQWDKLNFKYFSAGGAGQEISKIKVYQSAGKISQSDAEPLRMWLEAKTKGGDIFNYIPHDLKISPPVLAWDGADAALSIIYGAAPGTVKISGPLYFYNKGFKTSVKVLK